MLAQDDINLEADYQRDIVWHTTKQTGLIDSIFKNFYVPPVIFAVTNEDGFEKRVCIDGKQRLTSIWNFMQGKIPFKDSLSGEKFYYKDDETQAEKGKHKILPERYRRMFRTKQIVCVEYNHLNPDSEREIFQRVQLGVALNAAEKLQAIHGPTSIFIREILADFVHEGLETSLEWDTSRANDFRCVATAVNLIEKWPCKVASMPALTKWLQTQTDELEPAFKERIRATFKIFAVMAKLPEYQTGFRIEDTKTRRGEKYVKVAPAEFICITLLIDQHKKHLTLKQLSEAIQLMRKDVRGREQDIRTNSRVFNHMLKFIKELKASKLHADDAKAATVAGIDLYKRKIEIKSGKEAIPPSPTTKKRKSRESDDDDDDYVEARKPSTSAKKPATRATKTTSVSSKASVTAPLPVPSPAPSQHSLSQASTSRAPPPPPSQSPAPFHLPSQLPPPQMPQMHPDRLAAIRSARATASSPRPFDPQAVGLPSRPSWGSNQSQTSFYPPAPPRGPNPDSLSQSLMSRMNMSYTVPGPNGYSQPRPEPYDPQRPTEPMQDNLNRGKGVNQWGQR
ncbi:hypothetical protein EIP86_003030 [Pleurotus ostreatoroseus]|nr:hypothetical protein EIP86_003030 [Pleurotus ostreatoroseus]